MISLAISERNLDRSRTHLKLHALRGETEICRTIYHSQIVLLLLIAEIYLCMCKSKCTLSLYKLKIQIFI